MLIIKSSSVDKIDKTSAGFNVVILYFVIVVPDKYKNKAKHCLKTYLHLRTI